MAGISFGFVKHFADRHFDNGSDIYLGKPTTIGLEGYLKYKLMDIGGRGGYLGIEPSIGVDLIQPIIFKLRGTIAGNGFVNVFAGWQGEQIPLEANVGIGVGGVGIYYKYKPEDKEYGYKGLEKYDSGDITWAANIFLEIGFPLPKDRKFRGLLRYTFATGEFREFKTMDWGDNEGDQITPQGQLLGLYFASRLEFPFR